MSGVDHNHGDFDVIVRGGLWFDGTGAPGVVRNLGIRDGVVVTATSDSFPQARTPRSSTRTAAG